MFSSTFIIGNNARCWNTSLTLRRLGGRASTDLPLIRMSPSFGASNPAIILSRVVFPQPEGPRMEKNEPLGIRNETPSTAVNPPKRFLTRSHSRSYATGRASHGPGGRRRALPSRPVSANGPP